MTFGSEYIAILESYAKEQELQDDGNFGVSYKDSHANVRMACAELAKIYINEKQVSKCYPDGSKKLWKTFIPIETCDYDHKMVDGVTIEVVCVREEYFNIHIHRSSRPDVGSYMKPFNYANEVR